MWPLGQTPYALHLESRLRMLVHSESRLRMLRLSALAFVPRRRLSLHTMCRWIVLHLHWCVRTSVDVFVQDDNSRPER
jgi:hypothetical protein